MFFLLYRHINDGVIDDFPKIFEHFPKISEDCTKFFRRSHKRCRKFSEDHRRIAEDSRGRPEDISIIHQDKLDIGESIDIITSKDMENTPLESRVWLCMNFTSVVLSSKTLVSYMNGGYCVNYSSNLFCNARSFENWGILPSFSWGIFGHMTCLDRKGKILRGLIFFGGGGRGDFR